MCSKDQYRPERPEAAIVGLHIGKTLMSRPVALARECGKKGYGMQSGRNVGRQKRMSKRRQRGAADILIKPSPTLLLFSLLFLFSSPKKIIVLA